MDFIRKQNIVVVILGSTMLVIIFAIIVLVFGQKNPSQESSPTPTITPSSLPITSTLVDYDTKKSNDLLNKLKNRQALSQQDELAKGKILSLLPAGQPSGVLYKSENIIIDYINNANIFQVEILTTNIINAKSEAVAWFNSQGLSQQGICNYPVQFYLNYDVSQSLKDSNIQFSPLAEGC